MADSVWGVDHGIVSKAIPGQTMGAASRAAGVNVLKPVARQSMFPKPGTGSTPWKPQTPKAPTTKPLTGQQPAGNKVNRNPMRTPLIAGAAAGGGLGAGLLVNRRSNRG